MNIVAHLDTNLIMPNDIPKLTPESIKSRIVGSKLVLVVEQSMIMTIWGCKICLLLSKYTRGYYAGILLRLCLESFWKVSGEYKKAERRGT
jgi:hypothetical protein